jgi:hypothetical protein
MAAVDIPPVVGLVGDDRQAFRGRPGPRRLARAAVVVTVASCPLSWWLASKLPPQIDRSFYAVMPVMCVLVASVGLAVRRARVWLTSGGLRWGWDLVSIRVEPARLRHITIFADGLALSIGRGAPWFLARRDWDQFDAMVRAALRTGLPTTVEARRAPLRARLQAYGTTLDVLMLASILAALAIALAAAG